MLIKFRFWLARLIVGKHGMIYNMTFDTTEPGIKIVGLDPGRNVCISGNTIVRS